MEDGTREILPHPLEALHAEKVTRKRWEELDLAERIWGGEPCICLACGAVDYYPRSEVALHGSAGACLDEITRLQRKASRSTKEAPVAGPCKVCGESHVHRPKLVPGPERTVCRCPRCKQGEVQWEVTAVS